MKQIIILIALLLTVAWTSNVQGQTTLTFPTDINNFQKAVEQLPEGGILLIKPGTYYLKEALYLVNKNIQIVGLTGDPNDVVLESSSEGALKISAENASVRGVTLQVKAEAEDAHFDYCAIVMNKGNSLLSKCRIHSDSGNGIAFISNECRGRLEHCEIYDFESCRLIRTGIIVTKDANPIVRDCKVYNSKIVGIVVNGRGRGTFEKCEIDGNDMDGILVGSGGNPIVRECSIHDCDSASV